MYFYIFFLIRNNIAQSKIDEVLSQYELTDKIVKEEKFYNSKLDTYARYITFSDEPNIKYLVELTPGPSIKDIINKNEYQPRISCNGYENGNLIDNKKTATHTFTINHKEKRKK
ncbi:hypothetical protein QSV55_08430 [Macrococcus bovicus]|nr:hypothetical protein QSV55_08430 [Macrococcus bovicus]